MADAHTRHTPAGMRWFCNLCPWEGDSIDDTTQHLETHEERATVARRRRRHRHKRHSRTDAGRNGRRDVNVRVRFAWYDMWIGAYWDRKTRVLYICLLPTLLLEVSRG